MADRDGKYPNRLLLTFDLHRPKVFDLDRFTQVAVGVLVDQDRLPGDLGVRFEPGRKNGKPVRFRMRVPITFPRG